LNGWMYATFQTGGPEDYKTSYGQSYVEAGNFNYGAVCNAVGFSLTYCQSAAGTALYGRTVMLNEGNALANYNDANVANGSGNFSSSASGGANYNGQGIPFVSAPFGDQPGDSQTIAQGYAYQGQGCD